MFESNLLKGILYGFDWSIVLLKNIRQCFYNLFTRKGPRYLALQSVVYHFYRRLCQNRELADKYLTYMAK